MVALSAASVREFARYDATRVVDVVESDLNGGRCACLVTVDANRGALPS